MVDFACDFMSIDIMKVSSQITMLLTFFPLQNGLLVVMGIFELMSSELSIAWVLNTDSSVSINLLRKDPRGKLGLMRTLSISVEG